MDAQTVLIIWAVGAYLGWVAVYAFEGDLPDAVAAMFWPIALVVLAVIASVVYPAEGVKWCIRRFKGGR